MRSEASNDRVGECRYGRHTAPKEGGKVTGDVDNTSEQEFSTGVRVSGLTAATVLTCRVCDREQLPLRIIDAVLCFLLGAGEAGCRDC